MRIIFWNTNNNKSINPYLISLVKDYDVDVLILAEYEDDGIGLCLELRRNGLYFERCYDRDSKRIVMFSSISDTQPGPQADYHSIQVINRKYILCGVHLFSDLHGDETEERLQTAQNIMVDVHDIERLVGTDKTIIIGDMNEMPYDKGCIYANGFHGLPVLEPNEKNTRVVKGVEYKKYYNPMWNFFGDMSYPPGTYYIQKSELYAPHWYILDQVIISQGCIPQFDKSQLKIITSCSLGNLFNEKGVPDKESVSDHFPIICEIKE